MLSVFITKKKNVGLEEILGVMDMFMAQVVVILL